MISFILFNYKYSDFVHGFGKNLEKRDLLLKHESTKRDLFKIELPPKHQSTKRDLFIRELPPKHGSTKRDFHRNERK